MGPAAKYSAKNCSIAVSNIGAAICLAILYSEGCLVLPSHQLVPPHAAAELMDLSQRANFARPRSCSRLAKRNLLMCAKFE